MSAKVKSGLTLGYCPIGNGSSIEPFDDLFSDKKDISLGFEGVDAVVFWGGDDIHPSLYKQKRSGYSQAGDRPSNRDLFEWNAMKYCKIHNIPMIGVCRGAQMMCAFAGGTLIQHANGHNSGPHWMTTNEGEIIMTTSCHHQMMYPWNVEHELLAWCSVAQSKIYLGDSDTSVDMKGREEPEVVYFPKVNGLAIQGHPEWARKDDEYVAYCNSLIRSYLLESVEA